jgi:predicted nucleic acid-binding protein
MSQFFVDFINQLDETRSVQKQVGEIMRLQLGIKGGAKEKAKAAEKSPRWEHLNDLGRRAVKREELGSDLVSNAQARLSLRKMHAEIRSSLPKLPGRDKDDLVGVLVDQENRAYVRGLPTQEQRDRVQRLHPDIAAAVARAPAELSGVSQSVHDELVNATLRRTHGAELAKIAADLATLEVADELVRETDKEIRAAADVANSTDFRVWAKPLMDPILADAGADFDDLYRRQESGELNVLGALAASAE